MHCTANAAHWFITGAIDGYCRTTADVVVDGERGAFQFTIAGVHTGDLPGFPATNEPVDITGAIRVRVRVRDGRLVEADEILHHDSTRRLSLR